MWCSSGLAREERKGLLLLHPYEHVCGYVLHLSCIIFDVDNIASVVVSGVLLHLARQFMVRGFYKDTRNTRTRSSSITSPSFSPGWLHHLILPLLVSLLLELLRSRIVGFPYCAARETTVAAELSKNYITSFLMWQWRRTGDRMTGGASQMDFSSEDYDSTELLLILRFTSGGIVFNAS